MLGANQAFGFVYKPTVALALLIGGDEARTISPFFRQAGGLGVALFFAISGFLLYQPFVRARDNGLSVDLKSYFVRRAARIIPAYWTALIVIGLATGNSQLFSWSGFVNYFMFGEIWSTLDVARLTDPGQFNPLKFSSRSTVDVLANNPIPVAWTLCVEVFFYLMLPIWAALAARLTSKSRRPIRLELIVIGALALASLAYKAIVISKVAQFEYESWLMIPPATIDTFLVGMALACLAVRASRQGWPKALEAAGRHPGLCWLSAAVVYAALCLFEAQWTWQPGPTLFGLTPHGFLGALSFGAGEAHVLIDALLLAPAVIGATRATGISRVLTSKVIVWIGLVSYGLYLWHMFVLQQVLDQFDGALLQIIALPFVALGCYQLALGIAALSWYGIEQRVIAIAHRSPLARSRAKAEKRPSTLKG